MVMTLPASTWVENDVPVPVTMGLPLVTDSVPDEVGGSVTVPFPVQVIVLEPIEQLIVPVAPALVGAPREYVAPLVGSSSVSRVWPLAKVAAPAAVLLATVMIHLNVLPSKACPLTLLVLKATRSGASGTVL